MPCFYRSKRRTRFSGRFSLRALHAESNRVLAVGAMVIAVGCQDDHTVVTPPPGYVPPRPPADTAFQKVTLNSAPGEPIGLAVLPDGRVLHTARGGRVWLHDPTTGFNTVAADIPVYTHDEEGLQGIAVDPDFATNRWVYLYYSPALDTPEDDPGTQQLNEGDSPAFGTQAEFAAFSGYMQLSRFRLEAGKLDPTTEQALLRVPVSRGICCHVGGDIDFDREGNLYLSTGDDTNPFESDGFSPIDWREGRNPGFDAARSSANTNDLRGKLLRIRVQEDGSYVIPAGNLFPPDATDARPEIYAMGLRNPFRFSVDRERGVVYMADYSPDASRANTNRGPAGQGRWMIIERPGNYGWPFCATAELPYRRFDFEAREPGPAFDCSSLVNDSPNNTGRRQLPPVVQPQVWYQNARSAQFPELGTGGGVGPMAGPAYRFDRRSSSSRRWPIYFDGLSVFYEWTRDRLFAFRLVREGDAGTSLQLDSIEPLLRSLVFDNPIDLEFGPDGALYALEYGDGYHSENPEAQLIRVDYAPDNRTPVAMAAASRQSGVAPLTVELSSEGSFDPDGDSIQLFWDFDADGTTDSGEARPTVTFEQPGQLAPTLRVVDSTGRASTAAVRVAVGNAPPVIVFQSPAPGQAFSFGQTLRYSLTVQDEDPVDCSRVEVQYILGHDEHGHALSTARGCSGQFETTLDEAHVGAANVRAVLSASYTDQPEDPRVPPLTAEATVVLSGGG